VKIIKQVVAFLPGNEIRLISSTLYQMMKEEVGRDLPKTKLLGCYDQLVRLITRLDDSIGGAHADWKEARADRDRIQMPSDVIIGKVIQSKGNWIFKVFRGSVREEEWIVSTSVEDFEPA
jgi:hypothetical protein